MARALRLAQRGGSHVLPNPRVGSVVVKNGRVIAEGWHKKFGGSHAEREALKKAAGAARGGTLYVTLEPCSHQGKQPPCSELILHSGIRRLVVATKDPNPRVSSLRKIKNRGIDVVTGVLAEEARRINPGFFRSFESHLPHLHLKVATSLDGFWALPSGESQWLTSEKSRRHAHLLRGQSSAVMTGVGTVLHDNPQLNVRFGPRRVPARLILDSQLKIPLKSKILKSAGGPLHIFTTRKSSLEKRKRIQNLGVHIHLVKADRKGRCSLRQVLKHCVTLGLTEILVESGPQLATALLKGGFIGEVSWFQGSCLLGDGLKLGPLGIHSLKEAYQLDHLSRKKMDTDILWHGFLEPR